MSTVREIVISRKVDAPLKIVFDAFTHPDHIGQWWGPNGFTTTTKKMGFGAVEGGKQTLNRLEQYLQKKKPL